jgi:hypothetical protein
MVPVPYFSMIWSREDTLAVENSNTLAIALMLRMGFSIEMGS